jgi:hypothetical protein
MSTTCLDIATSRCEKNTKTRKNSDYFTEKLLGVILQGTFLSTWHSAAKEQLWNDVSDSPSRQF